MLSVSYSVTAAAAVLVDAADATFMSVAAAW